MLSVSDLRRYVNSNDLGGLPLGRIVDRLHGVVGPHGRTCATLTKVDVHGELLRLVWDDGCEQIVDGEQTHLEFFTPCEIDCKKVALAWRELTKSYDTLSALPAGSFILTTGFPGCGKSTLARCLSTHLGILHFDFSNFAKKIIGRHPLCQDDYIHVGRMVEPLISEHLARGGAMIYDTTAIAEGIRRHHFDAIPESSPRTLVWVPTNSHFCLQRLMSQRPCESPDLRPNVTRLSAAHVRTFHDFVLSFEPPTVAVVVPNDRDVPDTCLEILSALESSS